MFVARIVCHINAMGATAKRECNVNDPNTTQKITYRSKKKSYQIEIVLRIRLSRLKYKYT